MAFENVVGKGENAGNLIMDKLSSAIAFSIDHAKILFCGKMSNLIQSGK